MTSAWWVLCFGIIPFSTGNTNFFLGLPLTPELNVPSFELVIVTPSNGTRYSVESLAGEIIDSNSSFTSVPLSNALQVTNNSELADRFKGIQVHGTRLFSVLVAISYPTFSLHGFATFTVHPSPESQQQQEYEYYALSTDYDEVLNVTDRRSTILLVSNINETVVSVTPTQTVSIPEDARTDSSMINVMPGITHSVTLGRLQTLLISSLKDLSGTRISSNKPLTVLSGHQCAQIPASAGFCEAFYVHVPPTHSWGQAFLLAPFSGRSSFQYYKLVTSMPSTHVQYRCSGGVISLNFSTAGNRLFLTIPGNSFCYLTSTNPIFVVQMAGGYLTDNLGDPAVAVVSPLSGHVRSTKFVGLQPVETLRQFITVTVQAHHFQPSQIHLDDEQLFCTWSNIRAIDSDDIVGYGCTARITAGVHVVSHLGENGVLSVTIYGWSTSPQLGYAYLTGIDLESPNLLVPGSVTNLRCPSSSSGSGSTLRVNWDPPSVNPGSVSRYLVELQEYFLIEGSRMLNLTTIDKQQLEFSADQVTFMSGLAIYIPYRVIVKTRNLAGMGHDLAVECFTQQGAASRSPGNITVNFNRDGITVTWQPLTLIEARGFIEYIVNLKIHLSLKRQIISIRVPMDRSNVTITGLDPNQEYEVTVGTVTVSTGMLGPVSATIIVVGSPESDNTNTIVISVSIVFVLTVLIVAATVAIMFGCYRCSANKKAVDLRLPGNADHTESTSTRIYEEIREVESSYVNPLPPQNNMKLKDNPPPVPAAKPATDQGYKLTACPAYAASSRQGATEKYRAEGTYDLPSEDSYLYLI